MIGKFKQVPEILANPDLAYRDDIYNHGGRHPKYYGGGRVPKYTSGGGFGAGQAIQGKGGVGSGYVSPYSQNMGEGTVLSGVAGGLTDDYGNLLSGSGAGPGYQGLTPYEGGSVMAHELINPRVSSFNDGGRLGEVASEVPVFPDAPGMNKEGYQTEIPQINPHVSDDSYQSFSAQLKLGENAANKGYDADKELWFPFDVGINKERNIGWGINMSTFSEEEKLRISQGVTSEEIEEMFNNRISKHLDKSKEKITEMGGDWDTLPDNVKLALTDFSYNLGSLKKFPKFTQAVIDNDLETAKKEYKRYYKDKGVKKEMTKRNEDIVKMLFQDAKGDGKIYKKGGTYVTTTQDKNQKLTPSESKMTNPYTNPESELKNTLSKSFSKGGKFNTGGTVKKNSTDEDEVEAKSNYSKSASSRNRGAFPRMSNESITNGNVNESTFLAISMAQYYGWTGEINMTSGQRGGKDQTRVYSTYQREDAGVYRRYPEYQQSIADSLGVSLYDYKNNNVTEDEWDNQDTDAISGWIDDIWAKVQSGEMNMEEAGKLYPMHHMEGAAGDFTGGFKNWLNSSKSKQFREDFNIEVLDESDHFHVTFGQNINMESLPEKYHADYLTHKNQFSQLSIDSPDVAGTRIINMNPLSYQGEQRGVLTNDQVSIKPQEVTLGTDGPPTELSKATPPPGFQAYQEYRDEATKKQQKTTGYQLAETFGYMDKYNPQNPILSYDEWLNENPEHQEYQEQNSTEGSETVRVGDHGVPFNESEDQPIDNILNPEGVIEEDFSQGTNPYGFGESGNWIEDMMNRLNITREEAEAIIEKQRTNPNNPNNFPEFTPPEQEPFDPGYPAPTDPYNPVPRTPTPGPWETLPDPGQPSKEPEWFSLFNVGVNNKVKDINKMINPYGG